MESEPHLEITSISEETVMTSSEEIVEQIDQSPRLIHELRARNIELMEKNRQWSDEARHWCEEYDKISKSKREMKHQFKWCLNDLSKERAVNEEMRQVVITLQADNIKLNDQLLETMRARVDTTKLAEQNTQLKNQLDTALSQSVRKTVVDRQKNDLIKQLNITRKLLTDQILVNKELATKKEKEIGELKRDYNKQIASLTAQTKYYAKNVEHNVRPHYS